MYEYVEILGVSVHLQVPVAVRILLGVVSVGKSVIVLMTVHMDFVSISRSKGS